MGLLHPLARTNTPHSTLHSLPSKPEKREEKERRRREKKKKEEEERTKMKIRVGLFMVAKRAAAAHFGWASKVPTPTLTLPHLPHLPAAQQVRCFTTTTERFIFPYSIERLVHSTSSHTERFTFPYSIERLVHSTSSHTVFNGRLNGNPMSMFKVPNKVDIMTWLSNSAHFVSDNCLRIQFPIHSSIHGLLFFTERVECTLEQYLGRFPSKLESLNPTAIIPEIRLVLGGVLDLFLKCRSNQDFRYMRLENLYWTGRNVVGFPFRKGPIAKQKTDLDGLNATLVDMFGGSLPTCLKELLKQIDVLSKIGIDGKRKRKSSLPLQYLVDNHYSRMGSQERISYRAYVVRNALEGSVRWRSIRKMRKCWKRDPICKLVKPVAWKAELSGSYGGGSTDDVDRWNRQLEDPFHYLIMARNIAEHYSYNSSAGAIDEHVINTYPGHADAILRCIHALNPDLNFVKMKE